MEKILEPTDPIWYAYFTEEENWGPEWLSGLLGVTHTWPTEWMLRPISKWVKGAYSMGMKRSGWDWLRAGWARLHELPWGTSFSRSKTGLSGGKLRCASSRRDFVSMLSVNALARASCSAELGVKPWRDLSVEVWVGEGVNICWEMILSTAGAQPGE